MLKINENSKRTLEQEINGYKQEAHKQAKQIWSLEKEREAYATQASEAVGRYVRDLFAMYACSIG